MSVLNVEQQRCLDFPITKNKVFLAHAAVSPFPRRVTEAVRNYCEGNSEYGQWDYLYGKEERETRQYAAVLFGCTEDEIALISSTSMGLSIVATGLSWNSGDNVIVADGDFPSNIYPWLSLRNQGVEIRFIPKRSDASVYVDDVAKLVDARTRLVALSSVNFVTGFKIDIDTIGEYLQSKNVLFCVDAVQSLGVLPFDSTYVDFAASSAHKWLMGPMGIGILFVKKKNFERLEPRLVGWKTVKDNKNYLNYDLSFPESARRYEMGSPNGLGIVGLHAALEILLEEGIDNIAKKLSMLTSGLPERLVEAGYEVISPCVPNRAEGIVSFTHNKINIPKLREFLDTQSFIVSLRSTIDGRKCIRVSPHFYNLDDDISSLVSLLSI